MAGVTGPDCPPEEVLSAWLDGATEAAEHRLVDRHLAGCPACTQAAGELGAVRQLTRSLPDLDPPPGLLAAGHPDDELSAYLDGELPTAEIEALSGHLSGCAECRRRLQEVDAARTAIRALPRLEPLVREGTEASAVTAVTAARSRHRVGLGVAITAGAAAVVTAFTLTRGPAPTMIDPGDLASRHGARSAVDPGLSLPVFELPGGTG
jgi:anti-sigma factor RsiW